MTCGWSPGRACGVVFLLVVGGMSLVAACSPGCSPESNERCRQIVRRALVHGNTVRRVPFKGSLEETLYAAAVDSARIRRKFVEELRACGSKGERALAEAIKSAAPGRGRRFLIGLLTDVMPATTSDAEVVLREVAYLDLTENEVEMVSYMLARLCRRMMRTPAFASGRALEWSYHKKSDIRQNSVVILLGSRDPECAARVRDLLVEDACVDVRRNAATMGFRAAGRRYKENLRVLWDAMQDPDDGVRRRAWSSLRALVEPGDLPGGGDVDPKPFGARYGDWYGKIGSRLEWSDELGRFASVSPR